MDEPGLQVRLPREQIVEAGGVQIAMLHNAGPRAGREARLAARYPDCAAVVYGHTHVPQAERVGTHWILNPGSPTERRSAPRRTMLVLQLAAGGIEPHLLPLS
jgi:putative phosphoesterase